MEHASAPCQLLVGATNAKKPVEVHEEDAHESGATTKIEGQTGTKMGGLPTDSGWAVSTRASAGQVTSLTPPPCNSEVTVTGCAVSDPGSRRRTVPVSRRPASRFVCERSRCSGRRRAGGQSGLIGSRRTPSNTTQHSAEDSRSKRRVRLCSSRSWTVWSSRSASSRGAIGSASSGSTHSRRSVSAWLRCCVST